jgi:hypothetical protein
MPPIGQFSKPLLENVGVKPGSIATPFPPGFVTPGKNGGRRGQVVHFIAPSDLGDQDAEINTGSNVSVESMIRSSPAAALLIDFIHTLERQYPSS